MKKQFILLFLFLGITIGRSQSQDLANLANGKLLYFKAVYDDQIDSNSTPVVGYLALYEKDQIDKKHKNFEYVILDKNLNKTANNTFEGAENAVGYFGDYSFRKKILQLSPNTIFNYFSTDSKHSNLPSILYFDIKTNTRMTEDLLNTEDCFENNAFYKCNQIETYLTRLKGVRLIKNNKINYESYVYPVSGGGSIVQDFDRRPLYQNNARLMAFDKNKKKLWEKKYSEKADDNNNENYSFLSKDSLTIYYQHQITIKGKTEIEFVALNVKDGSIKAQRSITEIPSASFGLLSKIKTVNYEDKVFCVSDILNDKYRFNDNHLGYFRITFDKKKNKIDLDTFTYDDVKKIINLDKGYNLSRKDVFILRDGNVQFITEKTRLTKDLTEKTTDIVCIATDAAFKIKDIRVLEKDKSSISVGQQSDYLFSQYYNNDQNLAFFYQDYQKDDKGSKNWNLYINTIINGKFNQEKLPITSKENTIVPYEAKEGYILLREYNEKEKYNQIRLEKLNY